MTDPERSLLLIYGTLKRGQPSHEVVLDGNNGRSRFVGRAQTVSKWPLVIASKYNIPFLLHKEGVGNRIWGEIYEVDSKKLQFLDHFEGYPTYYDRLSIQVELHEEGKEPRITNAFVYVLRDFKTNLLQREMFTEYDSYGPHGLQFVTSEQSESYEDTDDEDEKMDG